MWNLSSRVRKRYHTRSLRSLVGYRVKREKRNACAHKHNIKYKQRKRSQLREMTKKLECTWENEVFIFDDPLAHASSSLAVHQFTRR